MRVQMSPTSTSQQGGGNPYVEQLVQGLRARGVCVEDYERRRMLDGYDVVHINWPHHIVRHRDWATSCWDMVRTVAFMHRARRRGARVVWTVHDLGGHEHHHPRLERLYERAFAGAVTDVISLTRAALPQLLTAYPPLRRARIHVVPHGHYRGDYPDPGMSRQDARRALGMPTAGRLVVVFGMLRRYKGIDEMMRAVAAVGDPEVSLLVAGECRDEAYAAQLASLADELPGVTLRLGRVDEAGVAILMRACDIVYAAYPPGSSLNSGVAVLALSCDRPVVVRDTPVMRELRDLTGGDWVHPAGPGEDVVVLAEALAAGDRLAGRSLDLSFLDWDRVIDATLAVYRGDSAGDA